MRRLKINVPFDNFKYLLLLCFLFIICSNGYSQKNQVKGEQYLIGEEEKLEMNVHIWGEVRSPGEYRVPDNTNVLELISKAGGTTEFSNLSEVILTREGFPDLQSANAESNSTLLANNADMLMLNLPKQAKKLQKRVIKINLKEYLEKEHYKPFPKLQPGDVIRIKRNQWFRWQSAIRIASQIAIVFQAMYYFSRIYD